MPRGDPLLLEVVDFRDPQHWRWVLKDSSYNFLQSHEVSLDPEDTNYRALMNLQGYLDSHSSPDNRTNDQLRLLDEVGTWIGQNIFGRIIPIILDYAPITVKVLVPPEASSIKYLPLELARLDGKHLALEDVSLVFQEANSDIAEKIVGDRLRVLGVFSLPTDISALALRRERYQLMKFIEGISQNHGVAIDLRVLQYGTTRKTLQDVLSEGDGWDLIHFSGHGSRALLVLEKEDGTQDPIDSNDFKKILRRTRHRVKLVTLSSCLSAAATIIETLKWLGVSRPEQTSDACEADNDEVLPSVASALVKDLDCAVLAMRYPVGDEFAIEFAQELYEGMLGRKQTLTSALQVALTKILGEGYDAATPPLSVATPALFGARAANLIIEAPKIEFEVPDTSLASFPNEPKRFVGRVDVIGPANKALAPRSDKAGVLFYGLAGGGKTACALELAYHYSRSRRFRKFVWYKAPKEGDDIATALLNLAVVMENQIPGLKMVHIVDRDNDFESWLPQLTETMERSSILVVLDNLESLLATDGEWRDERWNKLIKAMLAQEGRSRVILTSRRKPNGLDENRICVESLHALSLDESTLLARELPNLSNLLLGKSAVGLVRGRELVTRTLKLVQGHPKLIELAEDQADDPEALTSYLDKADETWKSDDFRLKAFFDKGVSSLDAQKFLEMLLGWTHAISATLTTASKTLFHLLCALEEPDRQSWIVEQVWPDLWKYLGIADQAPNIAEALQDLKTLVEVQALEEGFSYIIHPSVAEAGLEELAQDFRAEVNEEMAYFWGTVLLETQSKEIGGLVVLAGLSAAPYFMRIGQWDIASFCLQEVIKRDSSPGTISTVLPMIRHIAEVTKRTEGGRRKADLLAKALFLTGRWREAEVGLTSLVSECVDHREFKYGLASGSTLFEILLLTGRFSEALELVDELKSYARHANLGPWTNLGIECNRLKAMNALGRYREVLLAIKDLRLQMASLPEQGEKEEVVSLWVIKESIFDVGSSAAMKSEDYDQALELNAECLKVALARDASELKIAKIAFNDYGPLLEKERYDQAEKLIRRCKEIFERENDSEMLGKVFSALADLECRSGRIDQAIRFESAALRYSYRIGDPEDISISHDNLAIYFYKAGSNKALPHCLAGGIVRYQICSGFFPLSLSNLAIELVRFGSQYLPTKFDNLCSIVEDVEGVRFRELFDRLVGPKVDGNQVMREVIEMAKRMQTKKTKNDKG